MTKALAGEKDDERFEMSVVARGIAKAADFLSQRYYWVITNVPYLSLNKQSERLKEYGEKKYFDARHDLANVFIQRIIELLHENGVLDVVAPQNWLFLKRYKNFRERILKNHSLSSIARLGPGAFDTISGEVVKAILLSLINEKPATHVHFLGVNAEGVSSSAQKATCLKDAPISEISQEQQVSNPDMIITLEDVEQSTLLVDFASALSGCSSGDGVRFIRKYWENSIPNKDWEFHQSTVSDMCFFGGKSEIIFWESEQGEMYSLAQSVKHLNHAAQNWLRGKPNWGKPGVVISQMGALPSTIYTGAIYDCNCCAIIPNNPEHLAALWAYCSSDEYNRDVRKLNQKLNVTPKTLLSVPFVS